MKQIGMWTMDILFDWHNTCFEPVKIDMADFVNIFPLLYIPVHQLNEPI